MSPLSRSLPPPPHRLSLAAVASVGPLPGWALGWLVWVQPFWVVGCVGGVSLRSSVDEESFRRFAGGAVGPLGRLAFLLCGDRHLAEDLVQSCLINLYLVWHRIRQPEGVDGYVRQVLLRCWLNESRRAWRRRERRDGIIPDLVDPRGDPVEGAVTRETREVLARALACVPPRQRAAVVLRYWSQLSVAETAKVLRCSEGTVKSQSARGLTALREALAGHGINLASVKELTA
jgi:RNA polymerase sigma-70 factor (sigma-E family)